MKGSWNYDISGSGDYGATSSLCGFMFLTRWIQNSTARHAAKKANSPAFIRFRRGKKGQGSGDRFAALGPLPVFHPPPLQKRATDSKIRMEDGREKDFQPHDGRLSRHRKDIHRHGFDRAASAMHHPADVFRRLS